MEFIVGKLQYIHGDLFNTKREIIAHGCNTKGGFGSGVAGQIARLYPLARTAYFEKFKKEGWSLGEIQVVPINGKIIVNLATQNKYGRSGIYVDYDACKQAFNNLFRYAEMHWLNIAMPKIGSGLAGGEWCEVELQLLKALESHEVEVDVYYL